MLSSAQYHKLQRICLFHGTTARDYKRRKELYQYLGNSGYIRKHPVRNYDGYVITESGRAALHQHRVEVFHFWVPTVISLLALMLSAFSVLTEVPGAISVLRRLLHLG